MAQDVENDEHLDIRFREDEELDFFTELALHEAERWIQAVTRKKFQYPDDFRKSLGNGVLLCELLNSIKPGSVKRINKLPGPIAGLDNINVFLSACTQKFGLNDTQLFDPNDLEDLSHRAISDEDENLLKQEVDRRARNVAVTIYWLGKSLAGDNKVPSLDTSAFAALVHHGNKTLISDESFKNDSWQQLESPKTTDHSHQHDNSNKHIRDSSYDSLGSYEPESESSFDDLDGSIMPVRSDMKGDMKRYGSQGSLNRDQRLSQTLSDANYSDRYDSMYQSSPDLSQGSHAHTRSSSTDSAEGGYYGNHSRQSSGSTETYPTRLSTGGAVRKTSQSTPDPLQFVKLKGAQDLAKTAEKQIEIAKEVNKMRGAVDTSGSSTEEPDWQSNFKNWKNKRRKSTPAFASLGEDEEEKEEKSESRTKTFGQMMSERNKRRSLGPMSFYPLEDEGIGSGEPSLTQTQSSTTQSKPKGKKSKKAEVAPWARDSSGEGDSQSDSETNNSHQSGDTDSVFSDKSTPSRILSDDDSGTYSNKTRLDKIKQDSWVKSAKVDNLHSANKASAISANKASPVSANKAGPVSKRWESNVHDSKKKDDKKPVDMPKRAANIRNLTKAYEQKDKEANAEPVVVRRREIAGRSSFDGGRGKLDSTPPWKSLDLSNKSPYLTEKPLSPLSPTSPPNRALLPREQRYSWTPPSAKESAPSQEKPALNASQRSRYLETSSPPKHSKTLTFGVLNDKPSEKSSPATAAKPIRDRIMQAKAMFEKAAEEQGQKKAPIRRRMSENEGRRCSESADRRISEPAVQSLSENNDSSLKESEGKNLPEMADKRIGEYNKQNMQGSEAQRLLTNETEESIGIDKPVFKNTDKMQDVTSDSGNESVDTISTEMKTVDKKQTNKGYSIGSIEKLDEPLLNDSSDQTLNESENKISDNDDEEDNIANQVSEQFDFLVNDNLDLPKVSTEIESRLPEDIDNITQETCEDIEVEEDNTSSIPIDIEMENLTGHSDDQFTEESPKKKPFTEKMIKISQKPNNDRGFGFTISGGIDKRQPVTITRVSLGSGADINELEAKDEIITVNGHDTSTLTQAQVQAIIDRSVKRGTIDLLIKRYIEDEDDQFDSGQEEDMSQQTNNNSSLNSSNNASNNVSQLLGKGAYFSYPDTSSSSNRNTTTDTNRYTSSENNRYPMTDTAPANSWSSPANRRPSPAREQAPDYSKPVLEVSVNADNNRPSLMDQLVKERQQQDEQQQEQQQQQQQQRQQQEANNNDVKPAEDQDDEARDTEVIERMVENFSFSSQSMPKIRGLVLETPDSAPTSTPLSPDMNGPPSETLTEERPTLKKGSGTSVKGSDPGIETLTEERPTISVAPKAAVTPAEQDPVPMPRHRRTPDKTPEPPKNIISPPPPTPPKAEPPPLMKSDDSSDDSSFGPPAALLRWQRPRVKTEYQASFPSSTSLDEQVKASKRLSSTLPYGTKSPFLLDDYSKDDSSMGKTKVDLDLSQSNSSLRNTYHFDDAEKIKDWQLKQEAEREPEPQTSPPQPIAVEPEIQQEERLTAQHAAPSRRVGQVSAPEPHDINVPSTQSDPESTQEIFEREQERIRKQYEEERRAAQEAEKKKQEEEQKFLQSMEAQVIQTKKELQNLSNMEPIRPAPSQPKFNTEPMTIRLPANSPGRQLVIDPRNQDDTKPDARPEYSFHVDLHQGGSKPPLRTLNHEPEVNQEELLERERQKIREEEMRKLEKEKLEWQHEQEQKLYQQQESIRQERERLQAEQERIAREKAELEQRRHDDQLEPQYHTANSYKVHSPLSPPPALDPKRRGDPFKKAPPPTAPKPDKTLKARLTREDLLMMNRKPTPMTKRPEGIDENSDKHENSASVREPPTKAQLHSLNAVPKPKLHSSAAWIKEEEPAKEKPFVIGKRSDLIHTADNNANPQEHWLVREAERRRKAESSNRRDYDSGVTARAGPTQPSQSALINRFRGDIEPPSRTNRYSYPSSGHNSDSRLSSPRPLSSTLSSGHLDKSPVEKREKNVMQFSVNANSRPNSYSSPSMSPSMSQTLPPNFSFNANLPPAAHVDPLAKSSRHPRAQSGDAEAVIAVSGKQQCSHCGEELGFGAAMVIESLGLYYHVECFRCCVCRMPLGNGSEGADVRVRVNKLHCKNCYSNDEAGLKFSKV